MKLDSLCVVHRSPVSTPSQNGLAQNSPEIFYLKTCQREIWIFEESFMRTSRSQKQEIQELLKTGAEIYLGRDAYQFLLQVTTGLESKIRGETEILGQFKEAWRQFTLQPSQQKVGFVTCIQKLFEDTKEIRSLYLSGLGGSSYGSLVRKLLRSTQGPVFLLGAGQVANSIAPWLLDRELWIWNRSIKNLNRLLQNLKTNQKITLIQNKEAEEQAWRVASAAVVCIPLDPKNDERRIQLWKEGGSQRLLIHLGAASHQSGNWKDLAGFYSLDHLLSLQNQQSQIGFYQFSKALRACEEKSKLRSLGGFSNIAHGWEDLALFA